MRIFSIVDRNSLAAAGLFAVTMGAVIFVIPILGILGQANVTLGKDSFSWGSFLCMASGFMLIQIGYRKLFQIPYEVQVNVAGAIVFRRVGGQSVVLVKDIQVIQPVRLALVEEDGDARAYRIAKPSQVVLVGYFDQIQTLIEAFTTINPHIVVGEGD